MIKTSLIDGLHHVTAIAGSAKNNVRFYTEILGLRFVKKTINYDSPDTWHLYYGDETGSPGSALTFFPFRGIGKGRSGNGAMTTTLFSVNSNALEFWHNRLKTYQVDFRGPFERFQEQYISFEDFDGMPIELVFTENDSRSGWKTSDITAEYAIKGFYSALLSYASFDSSMDFLMRHMNHAVTEENENRIRLFSGSNTPGNYVDLIAQPSLPKQLPGIGTVHHLAFKTADEESQKQIRNVLIDNGFSPSPVMDRQYFRSIYFREPGGFLFEVATAGPGFLVDENAETLGTTLRLPHWLENRREQIQAELPPLG